MRKRSVLFITFLLAFLLINMTAFAENDIAVKINDSVLTVDEMEEEVNRRMDYMSEDYAKSTTVQNFISSYIALELIEEKDLELTDELIYDRMRSLESTITSQLHDTYPLGHFDGSEPPIEKIAERLAGFEEVDATKEELLENAENMAVEKLIEDHYREKAEERLEEGKLDEYIKEEFEDFIATNMAEIEELSEEQKEEFAEEIKEIKEMTFEDYKEEHWKDYKRDKADSLINESFQEIYEDLDIKIKVEVPHL